jgi:hypothetical protein
MKVQNQARELVGIVPDQAIFVKQIAADQLIRTDSPRHPDASL